MRLIERNPSGLRALVSAWLVLSACQVSNKPSFVGNLSLTLKGQSGGGQVVATAPDPCGLDIDFGNVRLGQQSTATVEITNESNFAITLLSFSPNLDPELSLGLSTAQEPPLAAGASMQLSITFNAVRAGAATSTFSIPTDAPPRACGSSASSDLTLTLTANGVDYRLATSPASLDFGSTLPGRGVTRTATLSNTSAAGIAGIVGAIAGSSASDFALGPVPSFLDAGDSTPVTVTYDPQAVNPRLAGRRDLHGSGWRERDPHAAGHGGGDGSHAGSRDDRLRLPTPARDRDRVHHPFEPDRRRHHRERNRRFWEWRRRLQQLAHRRGHAPQPRSHSSDPFAGPERRGVLLLRSHRRGAVHRAGDARERRSER